MAETVLEVQDGLPSKNWSAGVMCHGMHSDCGKNGGIALLEAEHSNPSVHTAPTQMDREDDFDLDSPNKYRNNTSRVTASSSASLEFTDFKADNQLEGWKELEISEELSNAELLPQDPSEGKPRQSGEWDVLEINSFPGMENIHVDTASKEKEQRISQVGSDLREIGKFVECVNMGRLESEQVGKTCDRRVPEMQAPLDGVEFAFTEAKVANQGEREGLEIHAVKSKDSLEKLEMQSRFSESGSVAASTARECIELQRSEDLNQTLAEGDSTLANPSPCQEPLRPLFLRKKSLQQQKEDITALEASELKAEEQGVKLRELENSLTRVTEQTGNLEKRCMTAETKAVESSSLLYNLQTKLDGTETELFEAKKLNGQVDAMKLRLQECEKELSHARSQGALSESSLRELKLREEHLQEVEQRNKTLEVQLKWRNEQFQSLEEAHSKLRSQFKDKSREWDTEKSDLFSDIDSLQSTLDSKECILREMQEQLQMVHHLLSREEGRRKVLELEAAESRQGLEQATAGYEEAQTTLETLREQCSAEMGTLRKVLGVKDRQLEDFHVKYVRMEEEYNELKEIEKENRAWQSNHGEQQQQSVSMKKKMSCVIKAHDNLPSRMIEVEKDSEKGNLVKALDQAHAQLSSKDETLKLLDSELDRVKGALEHAQGNCYSLDIQLKQCKAQLEGASEEAATARQALTSLEKNSHVEKSSLLESLHGKDKVTQDLKAQTHSMDQMRVELTMHEDRLLMQRDYEEMQQREIERDASRKELESIHNLVLVRVSKEENAWLADREKLLAELQVTQERSDEFEKQLKVVHFENERHLDVIRKLEARYAFQNKEMAQHCLLADQASEQLVSERTEMEKERRESRNLNNSLSVALSNKDLTVEDLKDRIGVLEAGLRRKNEETSSQNERVSHLEKDLKETADVLLNMDEHIAVMKSQACKTATELKLSEELRTNLDEELRKCREESLAATADFERQLEVARRDNSVLSMQLKEATRQLLEVSSQKELVLKDLDSKEAFLTKLTEENQSLLADKDSLEQVVHILEIKKVGLLQEVESSRTIINQLCGKCETAQSNLASRLKEVKDLQAQLQNVHMIGVQLLKAEEQNRDFGGYLKAAKAIAQDKEEKLAASEWAVQLLALDVGKAKAALTQKDREEALIRDELADVERQLRAKEGALIEMECYLEDALMSRKSMQREVDQLHQQMEDLNRGSADWKRKEQDMTTQLEVLGVALEEKRASLVSCQLEVKRGNYMREVMNGAIDSLKLQLADEQKALSGQQKDMNRLCEDLELSKGEANSASGLVKELRGKLQQLDQSSTVRVNQFQSSISELKDELSLAHHQLEKYQDSTRSLTEECSRFKEKCEALLDLNRRKDSSLKDMEAQLFGVSTSALEQSKLLEQRDEDLQCAKEQRECQDEKQISLQDNLSRIQIQRCELQLENKQLLLELSKVRVQLDASSSEAALKSKEIQSLQIQLEQARMFVAQGETQMLNTTLPDEVESLSLAVQERESSLHALQASVQQAQEKVEGLQVICVGKDEVRRVKSEKSSLKMQETLEGVRLDLKANAEKLLHVALEKPRRDLTEWKGKSAVVVEKVVLNAALDGARVKALEMDVTLRSLQEAADNAEGEVCNYDVLVKTLQGELVSHRVKEVAAREEGKHLAQQLEVALEKTEFNQQQVFHLQELLEKSNRDLKEKNQQNLDYVSFFSSLQDEWLELKSRVAAAERVQVSLKVELKDAEVKRLQWNQEVVQVNESMIRMEHDLIEERGNVQSLTLLEHGLNEERINVGESNSLIAGLQVQVEEWKKIADDSEGHKVELEVQHVEEAKMSVDHAWIEDRRIFQLLSKVEDDLVNEKTKVAESATLIAYLQLQVEGWKTKAGDAAKEGERVNQELKCASSTISSLMLQVKTHRATEQSMQEVNDSLQVDMNVAREEALARKEKMEIFLCELEQSQDGEKKLLENLQMEHERLILDLEDGGRFDCTFEIDGCGKMPLESHGNVLNIRAANFGTRDDAIRPKFHLEEFQISAEDCILGSVNKALEKDLETLRFHGEESQRQARELAGKLDAALSDVATKNIVIQQMNDEILGLRSLVKKLEQGTVALQDSLHREGHQCSIDTSNLISGREDWEQNTGSGMWKADIQEELNNYLGLCDSLVRKNVRLEKQLDGLQRKNRGLQKQVEGLQMMEKSFAEKECRVSNPVDCSPELVLDMFSWKTSSNVVHAAAQERRMVSHPDTCKGKVLGEIDENAVPGSLERCQMSRKPPVSPGSVMQQKKAKGMKDEV